jgi:hypothetical protein
MTNEEQALDQALVNLIGVVALGRAGKSGPVVVDEVVAMVPTLRRLAGEVVIADLDREMKPRKVRKTQGWIRRNAMEQRAARRAAEATRSSEATQ